MSESTLPAAPLSSIIARLQSQPIDNEVTAIKRRIQHASQRKFVLCDLSGSMDDFVGSQGLTKLSLLKTALKDTIKHNSAIEIVGFSNTPFPVKHGDVDRMRTISSTNLALALQYLAQHRPLKTIVISDGMPDDEEAALHAANQITGTIDVIYCGPDGHDSALDFMRRLTKLGGGVVEKWVVETQGALEGARKMQRLLA